MRAFLSYQMTDRHIAAAIRDFLVTLGIDCFMAHDDIEVSHEWRTVILENLSDADMFVALLSANYLASHFCMQESGIAVYRGMAIIPLSLDGTISPGFMSVIQSRKIDPADIDNNVILAGIARMNVGLVVDYLIDDLARSRSFRSAEASFRDIVPYLGRATDKQKVRILKEAADNGQIAHASLCATEYLPPIFATHSHLMDAEDREDLRKVLNSYAKR